LSKPAKRFVAHFPASFRLSSVPDIQPSGGYIVDLVSAMSKAPRDGANRGRTQSLIHLAAVVDGRWSMKTVPITASELGLAYFRKSPG
jgi:hypothetical protein